MGVVYKARDPEIGRLVAIKTLRSIFLGDDPAGNEALQRFRQESRSAGKLQHRNIVTIYEAGRTENGSPYIVMEHIEGESLEKVISEKAPLDPREALHYLAQVASAIDYAHSQGVIHRDIKPSNILVDSDFIPHLLDFGVAKLSDTSLTPAGTVVGTPSYMSPEQIRGEKLDGGTDRFALAVLTFEVLTAVRPFPGKDFTTVVGNIIHKEPKSFAEIGINLPPELETVLARGLAKDRNERYASALEFIDEVASVFGLVVDGTGVAGGFKPAPFIPEVSRADSTATITASQADVEMVLASELDKRSEIADAVKSFDAASTVGAHGLDTHAVEHQGELANGMNGNGSQINGKYHELNDSAQKQELTRDQESKAEAIEKSATDVTLDTVSNPTMEISANEVAWLLRFLVTVAVFLLGLSVYLYVNRGVEVASVASNKQQPKHSETEVPAKDTSREVAVNPFSADEQRLIELFSSNTTSKEQLSEALGQVLASGNEQLIAQSLPLVMANTDFRVRIDLLKQLSSSSVLNTATGVAMIKLALDDSEYLVRGFAARTLGQMSTPDAKLLLNGRLSREENEVVRKVIQQSIAKLN